MAEVVITGKEKDVSYIVSPDEIEIYSENGNDKIYTDSIVGKTPDKDGNDTLKLEIPGDVTVVNGETSVKVKIDS